MVAITASAVAGASALVDLLMGMAARFGSLSALYAKTRAENREPTAAELQAFDDEWTNTIRPGLVDAIARAKAEGR